jgi:hypothetical protein
MNWDKIMKPLAIAIVLGGFIFCWMQMQKACVH